MFKKKPGLIFGERGKKVNSDSFEPRSKFFFLFSGIKMKLGVERINITLFTLEKSRYFIFNEAKEKY